ncbi:hypothetical protein D3C72_1684940 [compost metagenome]
MQVRIVGVVGEAVVLFFRIVQQQAELHALAGKLAIGERSHAGQDGGQASLRIGFDSLGCSAIRRPVGDHFLQVRDEQFGRSFQIGRTAIAIAAGAGLGVVIRVGAVAGASLGAVRVLTPEQEFDGVIARGDVRLDAACFL